jgi:hypothetical protein
MFDFFGTKRKPKPRYVVFREGKQWYVKRSRRGYYLKHYSGMGGYWPTLKSLREECNTLGWIFQRA